MSLNVDLSPESVVEGGRIAFKILLTVFDFPSNPSKQGDSPSKRAAKRVKGDDGGTSPSEGSSRVRFHFFLLYLFLT